jgi:hypothetical protein
MANKRGGVAVLRSARREGMGRDYGAGTAPAQPSIATVTAAQLPELGLELLYTLLQFEIALGHQIESAGERISA